MKFELTEQERNVLQQLIDLAIKAGGLKVAEAGVVLAKKLESPIKEELKNEPEKQPS
jgi:hypothetical protein